MQDALSGFPDDWNTTGAPCSTTSDDEYVAGQFNLFRAKPGFHATRCFFAAHHVDADVECPQWTKASTLERGEHLLYCFIASRIGRPSSRSIGRTPMISASVGAMSTTNARFVLRPGLIPAP